MNIALDSYKYCWKEEGDYEVLDGKIVRMASPRPRHADTAYNLEAIFRSHIKGMSCRVFRETSVHFSEKDKPKPDICVVCRPEIITVDGIFGAPDLVAEILSPSTSRYDKGYKKNLYERYGVKEYWVVDTKNLEIEVYILHDSKYQLANVYIILPDFDIENMDEEQRAKLEYTFKTHLFDDLIIDIREVFDDLSP
ncbi:MAG: Uma2 family endonuclease [Clostridiales bacterium]|nr:Uma2 family endonuclease [Clostridiales bacterium]